MFLKRSDRRAQGGRSERALGLTLLALALSGAVLVTGAHGVAAGPLPPAGTVTGKGTVTGDPSPSPSPTPTGPSPQARGGGAVLDSGPSQAATTSSQPSAPGASAAASASHPNAPPPVSGAAVPAGPSGSADGSRPGTVTPNLDGVRVPPVEAMTPVTGLTFRSGLELGPALLVADLLGLALLGYMVRRRWVRSSD